MEHGMFANQSKNADLGYTAAIAASATFTSKVFNLLGATSYSLFFLTDHAGTLTIEYVDVTDESVVLETAVIPVVAGTRKRVTVTEYEESNPGGRLPQSGMRLKFVNDAGGAATLVMHLIVQCL